MSRRFSALLIVALLAAELSLLITPTSGEAPSLLSPVIAPQGLSVPEDPTIIRSRPVDVHFDVLHEMASAESQPIRLDLFDDASLLAVFDRKESGWGGAQIWTGYVEGAQQSEATLVFQDEVMSGNIRADGLFYQIRYTESGLHLVYEIDQQAFPEDAEPLVPENLPSEPDAGAAGDMIAQDSCTDIDVMVVYTGAARSAAGGTTAMNTLINTAISETNTGYANSGISQRMDLVYTAEVSYDETSFNWDTTLNRLTGKTDGYMDEVHTLRDTYKADAVVLIVNNIAYCGIAWVMRTLSASFESSAFSVVSRSCATGYYSLAHETGHNFGSMHDRANSSFSGVFDYSYGYQAPDGAFRTVMAYAEDCPGSCPRINYWSNPDVYYGGQPTGVIYTASDSADNRLSLNNTACTVANWRDSSSLVPVAPTGITASDGTYTDRVHITWDASTGATSYQVYRATSPTGTKIQIGEPTDTSFDDTTAVTGTSYYYWVTACNSYGCSGYSAYDTGWRAASAPTGVAASDGTYTNRIYVTWNASSGATSYQVHRATSPTGTKTQLGAPASTSFDDTNAAVGVVYYYWVKACNGSLCSDFSAYDTGWRAASAPTGVAASDGTYADRVYVTWNVSSGATSYQVHRSTSPTAAKTQLGAPASTSFDDTNAAVGVTYYYWVKACNGSLCSDFSSYDIGWRAELPANVVINEIDPGTHDVVELRNKGDQAMDMTGWHFVPYNSSGTPYGDYTFPSFTLQPGAYLILHEGSGTDTSTDLYMSYNIGWINEGTGATALTDGSSGVDFARFGASAVSPPAGTGWTGANPSGPPTDQTIGRDSLSTDTDDGSDWYAQVPSLGVQNLSGSADYRTYLPFVTQEEY